ncbi:MAG: lipopolysaccharide transport periplasmic protein LptA [Pseudomonadota bacterium]
MKKILLCTVLCASAALAWAEKADASKPGSLSYKALDYDGVNLTKIVTGDVVLTQGSLLLKSDKATVKTDPEGYQYAVLTADPGKLATFRQKRDGGPNLWVEGQAERIEYDQKNETVILVGRAKVRQLDGARLESEVDHVYIAYDSRKESFVMRNDVSGKDVAGGARGTMIFGGRHPNPSSASATAAGKQ